MAVLRVKNEDGTWLEIPAIVGPVGPMGPEGPAGKDGKDYVLTASDKTEIAEMVDGATIVQAPLHVDSLDKMTDTSRVYVLLETGHIWAWMDTTVEKEVTMTDNIVGTEDNPYQVGRLSSGGAVTTDITTHVVSPFIDLTREEYAGKTIELHLEGLQYFGDDIAYTQTALYAPDKSVIAGRAYSSMTANGYWTAIKNATVVVNSETSTTITMTLPILYGSANLEIGYLRMSAKGAEADSNIYITYKDMQTVSGGQWVDTGTTYAPALTDGDKQEIAESVAAMIDSQMLAVIGDGTVTV